MSKERLAVKNSVIQCEACAGFYRLPFTVVGGMLPVKLHCPICKHHSVWNEIPIISKRVVENAHYCKIIGGEELLREEYSPKKESPDESEEHLGELEKNIKRTRYSDFERTLRSRMAATLAVIRDLREALSDVANQFTIDCRADLETLHSIRQWDSSLCEFFFRHPFCALEYPCNDYLHSTYARYILSPRFFSFPYGYAVTLDCDGLPTGGMNLNVVNSYSLMNGYSPITQKLLALPAPIELEVIGQKIVGPDLAWLWQDIPGTIPDDDHTEYNPSIIIKNSELTRHWLARRAIHPWSAVKIPDTVIKTRTVFQTFFNDHESLNVWTSFVDNGRLALFCRCNAQLRSTAMAIAYLISGIKGVFCSTIDQKELWRSSYQKMFSLAGINNVIFCTADEATIDIQIEACQAIFIDATIVDEHIIKILRRLFNYNGFLMIISEDPLMDFDESDETAALVNALTGFSYQMKPDIGRLSIRMPLRDNLKFKAMLKLLRNQRRINKFDRDQLNINEEQNIIKNEEQTGTGDSSL